MNDRMTLLQGFEPLVGRAPTVLILGSMPSAASLAQHQYYARPQNAFWRIMGELCGAGPELEYAERTRRLTDAGIALWDVIGHCVRPGSLDSAIDMKSVEANDFAALLTRFPSIRAVCFNGRKSQEVWRRNVRSSVEEVWPDLVYIDLPSTSPAMATLDFAGKLERWSRVKEFL